MLSPRSSSMGTASMGWSPSELIFCMESVISSSVSPATNWAYTDGRTTMQKHRWPKTFLVMVISFVRHEIIRHISVIKCYQGSSCQMTSSGCYAPCVTVVCKISNINYSYDSLCSNHLKTLRICSPRAGTKQNYIVVPLSSNIIEVKNKKHLLQGSK